LIGRIAQRIEQGLGVAHDAKLRQNCPPDSGDANMQAQIPVRMEPVPSKQSLRVP
jgi:hypothetical protein